MSGMTISLTNSKLEFIPEALNLASELLSDIFFAINNFPVIDTNNGTEWNLKLSSLTADVGQFVEITSMISKLVYQNNKAELAQIRETHINLLFILKALNQACAKKDNIAMEDLIKYELKDNLTMWKIEYIAQIKKRIIG